MHIGFFHLHPTSELYLELARRIRARIPEATFTGVLPDFRSVKFAERSGRELIQPLDLCRYVLERWDSWDISAESLQRIERRYGNPHLWYHAYADRVVGGWPMEVLQRLVVATATFWEEYIETHRPAVFFNSGIAHLPTYLGWHVFQRHGIPFVTLGQAKLKGRMYVGSEVATQQYDGLAEEYERIRREGLAEDERAEAQRYIAAFRDRPSAPMAESEGYRSYQRIPGLRNAPQVIRWVRRVLGESRDPDYRNSIRAGGVPSYPEIFRGHLRRAINWRRYRMAGLFEPMPALGSEPYGYFALHYQPEATTLVNGQFWTNQLALVENIARSLPITHRLYVKEHRVNLGSRSVEMLRSIANIPNVRLLSPFADSLALTRHADVVFSIAGSVGVEAMLFRKPVVVFGDIFYTHYRHAHPAKEPEALPTLIHDILAAPAPDEEALLEFVAAVLNRTYAGFLWHGERRSYDPANLDRVADILVERVIAPARAEAVGA